MIARVHSSILQGIDAVGCEVEADVVTSADKPEIRLVGLADKAVQESVSRIQAALRNSGYRWPDFGELSRTGPKVTIDLAPADVKKDSTAADHASGRSPRRPGNRAKSASAEQRSRGAEEQARVDEPHLEPPLSATASTSATLSMLPTKHRPTSFSACPASSPGRGGDA
ncbi:MAG TPA: magnesium chelatase domain-containing protein [Phycisphaerae bacterium]|nr:magnesium chelatase domain-containing protein [Phycisphaerae bacterium]